MSKKYLSLEEAANLLRITTTELMRMREQGDIRGFADRGNWKFKVDDVEAYARAHTDDSSPEVPLFAEDSDDVGEQPTIISKGISDADESILTDDEEVDFADSDSDVRLVGGADIDFDDSDSDVKLVGLDSSAELPIDQESTTPEIDLSSSDSDVRLAADGDSDSDVSLMDSETITSFEMSEGDGGSDSDVQLVSDENDESDVTLMSSDDQEATPVSLDSDDLSIFEDDESGISLSGDSSLMLGGESGISLDTPTDSGLELVADDDDEGITLDLGDSSGISLDMDESGISLEADDDSGISLEPDEFSGTIPMMDALSDDEVPETQFEIPSLEDEDESDVFNIAADETGVLDMSDLDDSESDDGVFDLDEEDEDEFAASDAFAEDDDDLDLEDDVFDDDEDLDVFDADDDVFDDEDVGAGYARSGGAAMVDSDWGTGTFVGLALSCLMLIACGAVMFDLMNNMNSASSANPLSGMILDALGGLYGS